MDLSYQDLGQAGKAWVEFCLTPGQAISRQVIESGVAGGSVLGMGVPGDVNLPADVKLQYGPLTYGFELSQQNSSKALLELFEGLERPYGPCLLVFETDLLGSDDPYTRELPPRALVVDGQDFYRIEPLAGMANADQFLTLYSWVSTGYPLVAFILEGVSPDEFADAFRRQNAGVLGNRVIGVVNTIFDADGYSIWLPDSVRSAVLGQGD
jgi:hypothetical protein